VGKQLSNFLAQLIDFVFGQSCITSQFQHVRKAMLIPEIKFGVAPIVLSTLNPNPLSLVWRCIFDQASMQVQTDRSVKVTHLGVPSFAIIIIQGKSRLTFASMTSSSY
jgi:hypothetical protein